ncbi:MAG: V-type ATP synthase subunit F [Clostridia bacterium]|nr:V-type ATP synthase subunit F [Clostridia bacterium]
MTGRIAIVGDGDSIMVFRAAGVDTFPVGEAKKAREAIRLAAKDHSIIFVTEEFYKPNEEFIKRFDEEAYPVVISIPSKNGSSGYSDELLKSAMEKALGVDILFHND